MKNKFTQSLFLIVCSLSLVLTSCSKTNEKVKPVEPDVPSGQMENSEDLLDDFDFEPL